MTDTFGVLEPVSRRSRALGDWNDIVNEAFSGTVIDAAQNGFKAELWNCRIDQLRLIRVRAQPSIVRRWAHDMPGRSSGSLLLHLQSAGISRNEQRGRSAEISTGEGAICDPDQGYSVDFKTPYEMFVVEVPLQAVLLRDPGFDVERFAGCRIENRRSQLLIAFLRAAWLQRECLSDDPDWRDCVSRTSLDLAMRAIVQAQTHPVGGASADMRRIVIDHIRASLGDPDLRTSTIARALAISPRSVQSVFERLATTTSGFILERRLDRAAAMLRDRPGESITSLAYACGFSDSAYFSRCFRQRFGLAPRQYRAGPQG